MPIGVLATIIAALCAGRLARRNYMAKRARSLRVGFILSSIPALFGAFVDTVSRFWIAAGFVSAQANRYGYGVGVSALYVVLGMYIVTVVYYRRILPLTLRNPRRRL